MVGKYRRQATRRMAEGRSELEAVLRTMEADVPIYEPWIRHTEAVEEMLRMGRVAIEHEQIAEEARRQRLDWLRSGRQGDPPPTLNVDWTRGLADDYTEVLAKLNADITARLGADDNVAMAAMMAPEPSTETAGTTFDPRSGAAPSSGRRPAAQAAPIEGVEVGEGSAAVTADPVPMALVAVPVGEGVRGRR